MADRNPVTFEHLNAFFRALVSDGAMKHNEPRDLSVRAYVNTDGSVELRYLMLDRADPSNLARPKYAERP